MTWVECREERIRCYGRRAMAGLPLFDGVPSIDGEPGRLKERAACWACGRDLRMSRWNTDTFVSRAFGWGAEKEVYCVDCFQEHGWPETFVEVE